MTLYWNFRKILDVDPEYDTCVGLTLKNARCRNVPGIQWKTRAIQLLYEMDRSKSISAEDIQELAGLMLCKHQHNSDRPNKSHLNQVAKVSNRWIAIVNEHRREAKKELEKTSILRSKRELAQVKREAEHFLARMKSEHEAQVKSERTLDNSDLIQTPMPVKAEANLNDPFTTYKDSNKTRGNLFRDPTVSATQDSTKTVNMSARTPLGEVPKNTNVRARREVTRVNQFESSIIPRQVKQYPSLPSPPTTPLASRQSAQETVEEPVAVLENQSALPLMETSNIDLPKTVKHVAVTETGVETCPVSSEELTPPLIAADGNSGLIPMPIETTPSKANDEHLASTEMEQTRPTTPIRATQDDFGYANVTPSPTRFTTYLPARQQYGMETPPETPEMIRHLEVTITTFNTSFQGLSERPPLSISRKPLPDRPSPTNRDTRTTEEHIVDLCTNCGHGAARNDRQDHCIDRSKDEDIEASCFRGLGLRRLQKKAIGQMNKLRARVSGDVKRETDRSPSVDLAP